MFPNPASAFRYPLAISSSYAATTVARAIPRKKRKIARGGHAISNHKSSFIYSLSNRGRKPARSAAASFGLFPERKIHIYLFTFLNRVVFIRHDSIRPTFALQKLGRRSFQLRQLGLGQKQTRYISAHRRQCPVRTAEITFCHACRQPSRSRSGANFTGDICSGKSSCRRCASPSGSFKPALVPFVARVADVLVELKLAPTCVPVNFPATAPLPIGVRKAALVLVVLRAAVVVGSGSGAP